MQLLKLLILDVEVSEMLNLSLLVELLKFLAAQSKDSFGLLVFLFLLLGLVEVDGARLVLDVSSELLSCVLVGKLLEAGNDSKDVGEHDHEGEDDEHPVGLDGLVARLDANLRQGLGGRWLSE